VSRRLSSNAAEIVSTRGRRSRGDPALQCAAGRPHHKARPVIVLINWRLGLGRLKIGRRRAAWQDPPAGDPWWAPRSFGKGLGGRTIIPARLRQRRVAADHGGALFFSRRPGPPRIQAKGHFHRTIEVLQEVSGGGPGAGGRPRPRAKSSLRGQPQGPKGDEAKAGSQSYVPPRKPRTTKALQHGGWKLIPRLQDPIRRSRRNSKSANPWAELEGGFRILLRMLKNTGEGPAPKWAAHQEKKVRR